LPGSANVIALSADRALIDLLRDSLAGAHRVWRADDVAHAGELIVGATNAVFLIDASLASSDTPVLLTRVHEQFPDLPIVVAGRRDEEALRAPLISSGVIFGCLDNPASAECIRNVVDATQRQPGANYEVPTAAPRTDFSAASIRNRLAIKLPKFRLPKIRIDRVRFRRWTDKCLLLVSMLLTAWVLVQWKPWNYAAELYATLVPAPAAPVDISKDEKLRQLLDAAGIALSKDRLVDPPGQNSLELYRAALALDPDNDLAHRGIDSVADKLLAEAEQALQAHDMPRLASAVDAARSARPDHPRLEYYSLQLKREQERMLAPGRIEAVPRKR
jgi:hypothetical protein